MHVPSLTVRLERILRNLVDSTPGTDDLLFRVCFTPLFIIFFGWMAISSLLFKAILKRIFQVCYIHNRKDYEEALDWIYKNLRGPILVSSDLNTTNDHSAFIVICFCSKEDAMAFKLWSPSKENI